MCSLDPFKSPVRLSKNSNQQKYQSNEASIIIIIFPTVVYLFILKCLKEVFFFSLFCEEIWVQKSEITYPILQLVRGKARN